MVEILKRNTILFNQIAIVIPLIIYEQIKCKPHFVWINKIIKAISI